MDLFGRKRIEELEAEIQILKLHNDLLDRQHQQRMRSLDEREQAMISRAMEQSRHLACMQKRLHRIRHEAQKVREGRSPLQKLLKVIFNGKVC